MIAYTPAYPTSIHSDAAHEITTFFQRQPGVEAVLLMGSCARGKATPDSCLDILVLYRPSQPNEIRKQVEESWSRYYEDLPLFARLRQVGAFSHVDLEFIDGIFDPDRHQHGWTTGADEFELEVGNHLAYSVPLWEGGTYYQELRARWLPYYDEELRRKRLAMVLGYCRNNLAHIPLYAELGLYFQSFKRLYHAFEEFLQALFISRRTYPIAYDKWVKEGVVEILGLPELYSHVTRVLEISKFESNQVVDRAKTISSFLDEYVEK